MLTLREIQTHALAFSREWRDETSEAAEKQTFYNEFFAIFGIRRRRVASFEVPVQLRDGHHGQIDLFWRGVLLVEHKSAGKDLTAAFTQGTKYFDGIPEKDLPRYVLVSDFQRFRLYDLDEGSETEFRLAELHKNTGLFGFLTGRKPHQYDDAPLVNIKAAEYMAELHDALRRNGYEGHALAVLLVRLMFCMFADHTALFPRNLFRDLLESRTRPDGKDVGPLLMQVFSVLDQDEGKRQKNLDEDLADLPYVNGHLFEELFDAPAFDEQARDILLKCCAFDWSAVSPAIFGSMFQKVTDEEKGKRRRIGGHYTSEKNILKALRPLFLDQLRAELERARTGPAVERFFERIARIRVLDPACGCGNFLIVAYRELRQLEMDALDKLFKITKRRRERLLGRRWFVDGIDVDSMYGIEIEEFPCRVAETALYLIDHLMNIKASERYGENFIRLPLRKTPHIVCGNALRVDWARVAPNVDWIVGNPPFIGKKARSPEQVNDMDVVFGDWPKHGQLDYVAAWYVRALEYIKGTDKRVAFVSTNSLTQGEQVPVLWPRLLHDGVDLHFAHRTFRWTNDAPGQAAVYCVILGWGVKAVSQRLIFDYETPDSEPLVRKVQRINPYLVDAEDVFITARRKPLFDSPTIAFGNMPNDGGHLLFDDEQREAFLREEPKARFLFRPFVSAREFISGTPRWCLWLKDVAPSRIRGLKLVRERVDGVRKHRASSKRETTRKLADTPSLFGEIRQPAEPYILIPRHSSEARQYVPMALLDPKQIAADSCVVVHSDDLYVMGVLMSAMHMAWMRHICGRIKGDFRYSNEIVYNNFPWPSPKPAQKRAVREATRRVLKERTTIAGQSLADLYDADTMPASLLRAHHSLDRTVDRCYRPQKFQHELGRVRYLFERYSKVAGVPLLEQKRRRRR